jgi:hypothetical protein
MSLPGLPFHLTSLLRLVDGLGVSYSILLSPFSVIIRDPPIDDEFYLWKRLLTVPRHLWARLIVAFFFFNPLRGGLVTCVQMRGILYSLN